MIDEVIVTLGWDRRHAIKALRGKVSIGKKAGRRGPPTGQGSYAREAIEVDRHSKWID